MKRSWVSFSSIVVLLLIVLSIVLKNNRSGDKEGKEKESPRKERTEPRREPRPGTDPPSEKPTRDIGFDRRAGKLIYTKHARCRMACRHIDESEVKEILEQGVVNERKSDPAARPDPKYALEGRTRDGQQVRIVFAPTDRGMVVITVIDLDTDWVCHCK